MNLAATILVAIGVAAAWLGAAALLRLPADFDRLHCVGFVTATAGSCITAAVVIDKPFAIGSWKAVAAFVLALGIGAVLAHATGRALWRRNAPKGEQR